MESAEEIYHRLNQEAEDEKKAGPFPRKERLGGVLKGYLFSFIEGDNGTWVMGDRCAIKIAHGDSDVQADIGTTLSPYQISQSWPRSVMNYGPYKPSEQS